MSLAGKIDDKAIADEVADDEEEAITLVRLKSISVAREASREEETSSSAKQSTDTEAEASLNEDELSPLVSASKGDGTFEASMEEKPSSADGRPTRVSLQEDPFHKSRVPRKSVLKHSTHPINRTPSTYASTNATRSPPQSISPEPTRSPIQQERKCCVVM